MKEENKKRINKLMVPLTLKSVSLFSAFTMITTGMSGCKKVDKNDTSSLNNDITTSDTSEIETNQTDTTTEIDSNKVNTTSEIEISSSKEDTSKTESNVSSSTNSSKKPSTSNSQITSNNSSVSQPSNSQTTSPSTPSSTQETPIPSGPEITMPSSLTADNINNVEVFKYFADKLNRETFPNTPLFYYTYEYNGQSYTTDGEKEMQFILALLNYQYMDNLTLRKLFENETLEQIKQYGSFIRTLAYITIDKNVVYNFDKYLIDKNLANYLVNIEKEYVNASNGQTANFKNLALNYFVNKQGSYYYKSLNSAVDRYMYLLSMKSLKYDNNVQLKLELTTISYDISTSYDNMVLNMYDNIHSKTKIMINK